MIRFFCTSVDQAYLPRGLMLYRSLVAHVPDFRLWILCMDDASHDALTQLGLSSVVPVKLSDLERADPPLGEAKVTRTVMEYCCTCKSSLMLHVFRNVPEVDLLTYLDADLFFFSSPEPLYKELGNASIGIIGHRFPAHLQHLQVAGQFNAGWIVVKKDAEGLTCLRKWRKQCLEWCFYQFDERRFTDQKYLDGWPNSFGRLVVIQHPGANLAPWNLDRHRIKTNGDLILVDDRPLVFFHFHGIRPRRVFLYDLNLKQYRVTLNRRLINKIYVPYLRQLLRTKNLLSISSSSLGSSVPNAAKTTKFSVAGAINRVKRYLHELRSLSKRHYVLVVGRRVF